jgi:hypothetical protein
MATEARNNCQCRSGVKSDQSMTISGMDIPVKHCRTSASYKLGISVCKESLPSSLSMRLMLCLTATEPDGPRPKSLNVSRLPVTTASTAASRLAKRFA